MNLTLALFAFFITCAFSAPTQDPIKATTLQYVTRISMWVVQATLVVDVVFLLFFIFCVIRNEIDWLKMVTNVWTARQFIVLQVTTDNIISYFELSRYHKHIFQLKFTIIVCYLSTHINVVIITGAIFLCNVFLYVVWSRLMSSSRKAKQKYTNPNYTDENDNDN